MLNNLVRHKGRAQAAPTSFEVLDGLVDGRRTLAVVNQAGTAVAIDLSDERPKVIEGIAAGAILSDLREALPLIEDHLTDDAGLSPVASLPGIGVRWLDADNLETMIATLPKLPTAAQSRLHSLIGL